MPKFTQSAPTETAILEVLKNGCAHKSEIVSQTGISAKRLGSALSKMKRKQTVKQISHGVWGISDVKN